LLKNIKLRDLHTEMSSPHGMDTSEENERPAGDGAASTSQGVRGGAADADDDEFDRMLGGGGEDYEDDEGQF
jgi:hypothetical protein